MEKYSKEYKEKLGQLIEEFPVRLAFNLRKDVEDNLTISFRDMGMKKKLSNVKISEAFIRDENFTKLPILEVNEFDNVDEVVDKIQELSKLWLEEK